MLLRLVSQSTRLAAAGARLTKPLRLVSEQMSNAFSQHKGSLLRKDYPSPKPDLA